MEGPKLRLWAKLISEGHYEDYDSPPNIPLIAGASKPKKESLTEVVQGAATAIAKVLQPVNAPAKQNVLVDDGTKISPLKVATVRRSCLEDLKKLKELFDDNVLSETEFLNEKEQILIALKNMTK